MIKTKDYSFGNYICALRTGLGLSQFQLGALVGVTDKAVSKWENGDAKPRISTCHHLAEVLGVTINELLSCNQYITTQARKELDKMNQKLWKQAYERLSIYSSNQPVACWSRLAAEETAFHGTDAIQSFAVLGKIRDAARKNSALVTVAGDINSSYAAWLFGATEVNPLQPHYICPNCDKMEFVPGAADGFDLPKKMCACGCEMRRDGHNIPFEGYAKAEQSGTWVELRVSSGFHSEAIKVLFDFYKGTAYVLPVKIVVDGVDEDTDIYVIMSGEKTRPTLSADGFWHVKDEDFWRWRERETAFVFHVSEQLDRLELLLKKAQVEYPDFSAIAVPSLAETLYGEYCRRVPSITNKLDAGEICDFDLLIRLGGLEHGSWDCGNGAAIIDDGGLNFRTVPVVREDIWNDVSCALERNGIRENGLALLVMEMAVKGKFYHKKVPANIYQVLLALELPEWYPDYLSKVMYLFPKGHCVAHLMNEMLAVWLESKVQE